LNPRPPAPKAGALPLRHSPAGFGCRDASHGAVTLRDSKGDGVSKPRRYALPPVRATVEPLEGNKVKLSVEVDEAEFEPAVDAAFKRLAREVRIPGFRPGKAPRKVLESRFGRGVGREQALQDALPEYYAKAVVETAVDVIAPPEIDITAGQDDGPVTFDAVVEVRPTVSVPGYGGLRVQLARPEVGDEEIDRQIDRMRQVDGRLETVDRAAREGDQVSIDITGTLDGESQDGLTADDYLYAVGSGAIVPELDEQLRGAKVGDILEFVATHPDPDEARELRFRVLVKEVKETVLPELTDDWAADSSDFTTVADLRADLERRMLLVRKAQAQRALRERVGEALADLVDVEAPEPMVSAEMQNRLQDLALRLSAQGHSLDQWLAATGQPAEEITAEMRATATQAVKVDLALRAVADAEGIEVSEADLDAEIDAVAARVEQPVERVRADLERGGQGQAVRSDIRKRKALDWLLERVEVVDEDGAAIDRDDLELPAPEADNDDDATKEEEE
jgi:trigger factor